MATKSHSPGPNPSTTSSKPTPKNKIKETGNMAERPISTGGVMLEKEAPKKKNVGKSASTPAKAVVPEASQTRKASNAIVPNSDSTDSKAPRRRPRKLVKETTAKPTTPVPTATVPASSNEVPPTATSAASTTELEALKSRVRGLEAKVEELYKSTESAGRRGSSTRSPRRRGKGRKSSNTQIPTISTIESGKIEELDEEEEEEADEELERLEDELEDARQDLELYQPGQRQRQRPRTRRTETGDSEDIEEIPRDAPGVEGKGTGGGGDKQVTLKGSYRIPLPSSVNLEDVKTIQSGVSAAQNVARSFLEGRRAQQAQTVQTNVTSGGNSKPSSQAARQEARQAEKQVAIVREGEEGNKSWGEWFGGYSVAISRAVKNIEAEAAIESQKVGGSGSGAAPKKAAQAGKGTGGTGPRKSAAKPKAKAGAGAAGG